jgi:hypothetical protein
MGVNDLLQGVTYDFYFYFSLFRTPCIHLQFVSNTTFPETESGSIIRSEEQKLSTELDHSQSSGQLSCPLTETSYFYGHNGEQKCLFLPAWWQKKIQFPKRCFKILKKIGIAQNNNNIYCLPGPRGSLVIKAVCYKPEDRGFDTRWVEFLNFPNPSVLTRPWGLLNL